MAGPDAYGAQSAEQSNTVDSLHSRPNSATARGHGTPALSAE